MCTYTGQFLSNGGRFIKPEQGAPETCEETNGEDGQQMLLHDVLSVDNCSVIVKLVPGHSL